MIGSESGRAAPGLVLPGLPTQPLVARIGGHTSAISTLSARPVTGIAMTPGAGTGDVLPGSEAGRAAPGLGLPGLPTRTTGARDMTARELTMPV